MPDTVKAPRSISVVIDRVKAELPDGYVDLTARLDQVKRDCLYTAPEQMGRRWQALCIILSETLPDPAADNTPEWAKKIGRIIRDEE